MLTTYGKAARFYGIPATGFTPELLASGLKRAKRNKVRFVVFEMSTNACARGIALAYVLRAGYWRKCEWSQISGTPAIIKA